MSLNTLGSLILEVEANQLSARFIDHNNRLRDHFQLIRESKTQARPP